MARGGISILSHVHDPYTINPLAHETGDDKIMVYTSITLHACIRVMLQVPAVFQLECRVRLTKQYTVDAIFLVLVTNVSASPKFGISAKPEQNGPACASGLHLCFRPFFSLTHRFFFTHESRCIRFPRKAPFQTLCDQVLVFLRDFLYIFFLQHQDF